MSSRAIDLVIRRLATDAGLKLSAHTLRHTVVTNLIRSGADVVLVAEIAGHRQRGMPSRILSEREVEQLSGWPVEVARGDLAAFFTLSLEDLRWVRSFQPPRAAADRLGLAVQLCVLPFLGFVPAELASTPVEVVARLAKRIGVGPGELLRYVDLSATARAASTSTR